MRVHPYEEGARPSPSDRLPIEDLLENPDHALDPSPKDLNPVALRRKFSRLFDEQYFSIEEPPDANETTFSYQFHKGRPADEARPDFLKYLRTFRLGDGRRVRLQSGKKQRRRVQKLVWSFTHCPVQFSWKDLGLRFWPRWLKQGGCWNGRPCSIPPGMTCQPSANVTKTLLRWHCRQPYENHHDHGGDDDDDDSEIPDDKDHYKADLHRARRRHRRRPQCRWIPIQYPIISACSCRC
jgi:noggin